MRVSSTWRVSCASMVFLALGAIQGQAQTPAFGAGTSYPTGGDTAAVAVADIDHDNHLDIVVAASNNNVIRVRLGNGLGGFGPAADFPTGDTPSGLAIADFNGDTHPDVATANVFSDNVSILLGNGVGGFGAAVSFPTGAGPAAILAADFTKDGAIDLVVANSNSSSLSVLAGAGNGTFTPVAGSPFPVGDFTVDMALGDINGDTNLDVVVTNLFDGNASVLLGSASGAFTPAAGSPVATGSGPQGVGLADLDGDGDLDLVIAASSSNTVRVFSGNGNGTFAAGAVVPTGPAPQDLAIADFNGDGLLDVAVAVAFGNAVQVLAGNGLGGLGPAVTFPTGGDYALPLASGDFNDDRKPDLVVGHVFSENTVVLLNETCCLVSVARAGTGTGTVTSDPSRLNCGPDCLRAFPSGALVTLTATPAAGSRFAGWSGACSGTGPCTLSPSTDEAVTATFDLFELGPTSLPSGDVGSVYFQVATSNGAAPVTFTLETGALPPGLALGEDGSILGFPFSAGAYPFTLRATDGDGVTGTRAYTITIAAGLTITSAADSEAAFNQSSQDVALLATVSNNVGVNSGTVTFTVRDASTAIVGLPVTAPVSDEVSSAVFSLPAGTSPQVLTITAVYNGTADFSTSSGTSALTVTAAASTTAAVNATTTFNDAGQSVTLSATVTSPGGTVNDGTVTFTVRDAGGAIVGAATTSAPVSAGAASVSYALPAGTAPQTLTITADYNGSATATASTDATRTLTIGAATSATGVSHATATFNGADQAVPLSATVTSPNGAVATGTVTFTVRAAGNVVIGAPTTSVPVSGGLANVNYSIPGGTPAQVLTITAVYNGSTNFATSTNATGTLTIGAAPAAIAAANTSATFNVANQTVPLSATVTSPNGTVNGGVVTFTVRDSSSTIVGVATMSGPVSAGAASASYVLPGGTNAQTLSIAAVYDGSANFATTTDATHTLTVGAATTSTTATPGSVSPSASAQNVPLTAIVASGAGTVGDGVVTFTVRTAGNVVVGASVAGAVAGGSASASYTLPGGTPVQTLTITAAYGGAGNFSGSTGTASLSIGCVAIEVAPERLAGARLGQPFSQRFTMSPAGDATFTLTGTLPAGLTLSGATLSGTPAALGRFDFTVTATSAASGCTGSRSYTIDVMRAPTLVTAAGGGAPLVRAFDATGTLARSFLADEALFAGGIRVASGDVTGDGADDIITAPGHDSASAIVRVFDGVTGTLVRELIAYPYASPGGTYVATGDVNADGVADIITGRDGSPPEVRVFDGPTGQLISSFLAYDPSVVGGVRVAAGDLNGDGLAEIITAPDAGAAPDVRVFTGGGALAASFMAYTPAFLGGLYVAAGDVDGDGFADIVTGAGAGGGPHVRVFSGADLQELRGFYAYDPLFAGGVRVAVGDLDLDGFAEIITSPGEGGGPHVRVWDGATGVETLGFFAFEEAFTGGVFVAAPAPQSRMSVDTPTRGETVPGVFVIGGWAAQRGLAAGSEVDAIHAWAYPTAGGSPIFVGATTTGGPRPDVAAVLGGFAADAGFTMIGALPEGTYDLVVFVRNARTGLFNDRRLVRIVVSP